MKKNLAILGSTGSIGTQTLDIVDRYPDLYSVAILSANSNVDKLIEQSLRYRPALAIIADKSKYRALKGALEGTGIETAAGAESLVEAMKRDDFSLLVAATVGYSGLEPTVEAIRQGKEIALANKETLVVAGELITDMLKHSRSFIIPVDSEHSAIYQCLRGEEAGSVKRLLITASGGPFLNCSEEQLRHVTVEQTLNHPRWKMGRKITVDSATLMNKAFEIIEARWLFGIDPDRIKALIHPQSIVHSMVEFKDGAVKAQLGTPDMHIPIAYALSGGKRLPLGDNALRLEHFSSLTFSEPDTQRFPCLDLAYEALRKGGTSACVINAANEIAVQAFLEGKIPFLQIYNVIESTLSLIPDIKRPDLDDYIAVNSQARAIAAEKVEHLIS